MDAAACKDGYCVSLSLGTHNRVVGVVLGGLDDETDKGLPIGGNRPLCLYEAVSGRNAGFSRGGRGVKYDNSHSIQIYGQDRGAPLDACQGTSTTPPLYSEPAKANVCAYPGGKEKVRRLSPPSMPPGQPNLLILVLAAPGDLSSSDGPIQEISTSHVVEPPEQYRSVLILEEKMPPGQPNLLILVLAGGPCRPLLPQRPNPGDPIDSGTQWLSTPLLKVMYRSVLILEEKMPPGQPNLLILVLAGGPWRPLLPQRPNPGDPIDSGTQWRIYRRQTPPMFSGNLKPRRTRQEEKRGKEKKRVKETFRGPECQRYHYLHISLDEAHLAGLVSHSQWDPEVKGASYQDKRAADSWVMKRKKTLCELAPPFSTTKGQ
ncbi:hypothetical protein NQZ68_023746 [Dissostichus eleginoides]|nr:hypothetical protein NQZ68_023746 [Dissostichus eleginoides]